MRFIVVSPTVPKNIKTLVSLEHSFVVAVDAAVETLIKNRIHVDVAIGDFDSLVDHTLLSDLPVIKLNPIKDVSDTNYALAYAYENTKDVTLVGGLFGSRIDHLYANLMLMHKYPSLTIIDEGNLIQSFQQGTFSINKKDYDYISIFALKDSLINLKGVKYPLYDYSLMTFDPLGLSNEILKEEMILEVLEGHVIVFQTKQ